MTIEEAVTRHLLATPAVTAIVGARIYQFKLPQGVTLPAVRVALIDDPTLYHLRGPNGTNPARVQADVYAEETSGTDPYAGTIAGAAAVDAALSGQKFSVGSPVALEVTGTFRNDRRPIYEAEELREVRMMLDYTLWYRTMN